MTRRPAAPLLPAVLPTRSARRSGPASVVALVLVALLVGLLAAPLALAALAAPASAHDALSGSTPADGATVGTPPSSVDLTFGEPPLEIGTEVRVTGPDGAVVNAGGAVLTGTTVSQPLVAELPAGDYAVVWRVTSSDGHPISGELTFTAAAGTEGTEGTTAGAQPTPTDAGGAPAEPTEPAEDAPATPGLDAQATTAAEQPEPSPGADTDVVEDPSRGAVPWFLAGAVLLAAAAAAWWAARRRAATRDRG